MNDYSSIGDGIGYAMLFMAVLLVIFLPLGIWKLIEIIIWCCHHIHTTII